MASAAAISSRADFVRANSRPRSRQPPRRLLLSPVADGAASRSQGTATIRPPLDWQHRQRMFVAAAVGARRAGQTSAASEHRQRPRWPEERVGRVPRAAAPDLFRPQPQPDDGRRARAPALRARAQPRRLRHAEGGGRLQGVRARPRRQDGRHRLPAARQEQGQGVPVRPRLRPRVHLGGGVRAHRAPRRARRPRRLPRLDLCVRRAIRRAIFNSAAAAHTRTTLTGTARRGRGRRSR